MLKIVDVHRAQTAHGEYIVLQNQGITTIDLQGWVLATGDYAGGSPEARASGMYVFTEQVLLKPYGRVVLFTGKGQDGWRPTTDGKTAWVAYWGRDERVWEFTDRVVLLQPASWRRLGVPARVEIAEEVPTTGT